MGVGAAAQRFSVARSVALGPPHRARLRDTSQAELSTSEASSAAERVFERLVFAPSARASSRSAAICSRSESSGSRRRSMVSSRHRVRVRPTKAPVLDGGCRRCEAHSRSMAARRAGSERQPRKRGTKRPASHAQSVFRPPYAHTEADTETDGTRRDGKEAFGEPVESREAVAVWQCGAGGRPVNTQPTGPEEDASYRATNARVIRTSCVPCAIETRGVEHTARRAARRARSAVPWRRRPWRARHGRGQACHPPLSPQFAVAGVVRSSKSQNSRNVSMHSVVTVRPST